MDGNLSTSSPEQLEPIVQQWLNAFDAQNFSGLDLRKFWANQVPDLFKIPVDKDSLSHKLDQARIDNVLLRPLEQFITASPIPTYMFYSLKEDDQSLKACGRLFKFNELIYSCTDCSADSSCVLCVDCFKDSSHKDHKYQVSRSGGNGQCDCGDSDAWKTDPFCDFHKPVHEDAVPKLDEDVGARFKIVATMIVNYSIELLCRQNHVDLPNDLESEEVTGLESYATVLFNDYTHKSDEVISSLVTAIACQTEVAKEFKSFMDREGRATLKVGSFGDCMDVQDIVTSTMQHNPVKCEVIPMTVLAHQEHAIQLLAWLNRIIGYHKGLRLVFGQVMESNHFNVPRNEVVHQTVNLLECIMINETNLWKAVRSNVYSLLVNGMLLNPKTKRFFAKSFTKLYYQLMQSYIANSEYGLAISDWAFLVYLSTWIYTVPSLAHSIIEEEETLYVISACFIETRDTAVLTDLRYLLATTPANWTEKLRESFLRGFEAIVMILKWVQGMRSVPWQSAADWEKNWDSRNHMQLKVADVVSRLIEWCSSDFQVLRRSLQIALKNLKEKTGELNHKNLKLCEVTCSCIDYDVSSLPVSLHLPLSRMIGGLLLELSKHNMEYSTLEPPLSLTELMEMPLRTLAMVSQFRAKACMERDYLSALKPISFYQYYPQATFVRDIPMMQYVASQIDPNKFLMNLLNKFNLMLWMQESYEHNESRQQDSIRQTSSLVDEFLYLLLIIVSDRQTVGISKVNADDKEVIPWLFFEPCTSKPFKDGQIKYLIDQLDWWKEKKGMSALKRRYYGDFHPFYTPDKSQLKRFIACSPVVPPEFAEQFKPLRNLLTCEVFMHIVQVIVERICDENNRPFSEHQYEKVLHLVGVALHEEKRDLDNEEIKEEDKFSFTKAAKKSEFVKLLKNSAQSVTVESNKNLTDWLLKKFEEIAEQRNGEPVDKSDENSESFEELFSQDESC